MYITGRNVNRCRFVSDTPPDYRVGYKQPPLHSRFKKGQSGNPEGGRRRPRPDRRLVALLEAALNARMARRRRRPLTRRQAVVVGLVEKSAAGDLRAIKLLLDLVLKAELAAPPPSPGPGDDDDPRTLLKRKLARLAAAMHVDAAAISGTEHSPENAQPPSPG
jgi:hypothetical protein